MEKIDYLTTDEVLDTLANRIDWRSRMLIRQAHPAVLPAQFRAVTGWLYAGNVRLVPITNEETVDIEQAIEAKNKPAPEKQTWAVSYFFQGNIRMYPACQRVVAESARDAAEELIRQKEARVLVHDVRPHLNLLTEPAPAPFEPKITEA